MNREDPDVCTKRINFSVEPELYAEFKKCVKVHERTISGQLRILMCHFCQSVNSNYNLKSYFKEVEKGNA